jgi:signal transduction histidine kinase
MINRLGVLDLIARISRSSWKNELEKASSRYHIIACWVSIIFDPIFVITDYFNIHNSWEQLLIIRLSVAAAILITLLLRKPYQLPSYFVVSVPFLLISLQNAYTYSLIGNENLLGHNLNYMALIVGASMFVLWEWYYSVIIVVISIIATGLFVRYNARLDVNEFFVQGGLILGMSSVFMIVLIRARYNLTVKEIKARLALRTSNEEIQAQAEEIRLINENLELVVRERTKELQKKNEALEEYAFINAHKLRSPVASILGLMNLMSKTPLSDEAVVIAEHLTRSTEKLDDVITTMTEALEKGGTDSISR